MTEEQLALEDRMLGLQAWLKQHKPTFENVTKEVESLKAELESLGFRNVQVYSIFRSRFARDVLGAIFRDAGFLHDPESALRAIYKHKMMDYVSEAQALALVG